MEKKEKTWSRIKSYGGLYSLLGLILFLLTTIYHSRDTIGGLIAKMSSDIFNIVVMTVLFFGVILSFFGFYRQRWMDRLKKQEKESIISKSKHEEEIKQLKSEVENTTKQYDNLVEWIKLPKTFGKTITVEISPDWNKPHRQIIETRYGKFPHLCFDMRVINRTYHSFEPEEVIIKCLCDREEVYKGTWDKKTHVSETFDKVNGLPKFRDGVIPFHIPIKKLYDDMKKWKLEGTAKYKSKEPLIYDNQYANPEIDIHLEYVLSEKQISELKKEVEKALKEEEK